MLEFQALDNAMMHVHADANVVGRVEQEVKLWCLGPHPVFSLWPSARAWKDVIREYVRAVRRNLS